MGLHDITRAYRSIFVNYTQMTMSAQHAWMAVLVVFAVALVWGCWRARRADARSAEWVLVLALAALPFCGYLLARFVTHSIEVRYVLGAVVAISAMVAIAVSPWLQRDAVFNTALVVLGLGIVGGGVVRIHAEEQKTAARLASLVLPAEVKAALNASADGRLYVQDMGAFEEGRYYEPDADVKARMTLVYSADEELRWNRHDTMALTAMHMQHFTRTAGDELRGAARAAGRACVCAVPLGVGLDGPGVRAGWGERDAGGQGDGRGCGGGAV